MDRHQQMRRRVRYPHLAIENGHRRWKLPVFFNSMTWAILNRPLARMTKQAQTLLHKGWAPAVLEDELAGGTGSHPLPKNPMARTILALAQQGKSVDEIADVVYKQALDAGGGLVDIGIWKRLLDAEVRTTVRELVESGLLSSTTNQGNRI